METTFWTLASQEFAKFHHMVGVGLPFSLLGPVLLGIFLVKLNDIYLKRGYRVLSFFVGSFLMLALFRVTYFVIEEIVRSLVSDMTKTPHWIAIISAMIALVSGLYLCWHLLGYTVRWYRRRRRRLLSKSHS